MGSWDTNLTYLCIAIVMVVLNGFFAAAEFALVKVRGSQLDELVTQGRPFAPTARWLGDRMDASLSACQLGITMASLALGWVGEPAFAKLLEPLFQAVGITSTTALHTTGFVVSFSIITALHLVIGEQAPKIYAIRRPELMILWCAAPLKIFYVLFYPFLTAGPAGLATAVSGVWTRLTADPGQKTDPDRTDEQRERNHEDGRLISKVRDDSHLQAHGCQ